MQTQSSISDVNVRHLKLKEWILYLMAVFFYTNMTGMIGSYRSAYLVNVLRLQEGQTALFNTLTSVIPFILNFLIAMYIDGRKTGKSGKFRPLALLVAVPLGILLVLTFWTPLPLRERFLWFILLLLQLHGQFAAASVKPSIWYPL